MKYNIFIKTQTITRTLLDINESDTKKIINAYKEKKESIFLNGQKFYTGDLIKLQIYTFEHNFINTGDELYRICKDNGDLESGIFGGDYIPEKILGKVGQNVTNSLITDDELEEIDAEKIKQNYVDPKRLKELSKIESKEFDLTKLIVLLNELNIAYKNNLVFAIPPLIRIIIDHVPPIFEKSNFAEVCGGYGTRSFKESMTILDKSSRKIADSFLHTQIRNNENALPTDTQINFKNDLDVLLQEIVRKLK